CLAVCAGLLMTALGILTAPGLLRLMHTPKEILPGSTKYLRILFLAMVPSMVYNVGSGVLRAVGDSRRPLYFLIFACLVNVALDILFVIACHMSVAGVAIATALAQLAAAALIVVSLGRVDGAHRLRRSALRIDRDILLRTLRIGLPSGLQAVLYSLSNMVITTTINGFGTATVAAWVSLGKIDGLFWMINNAFGVSIMTFAGQNYGARKFDRIRKGLLTCGAMALAAAMLFGAVFFIFAVALFSLFTQDGEVLQIALEMMRHIAPWYWLFVPIEMISGSLRGMGNTLIPTLITAVGICLFRVFWMFAVVPNWLEIRAITISYPISWLLTGAVFIAYYLWMRKRLFEHNS
ncbi:MAG: MATE family efflux transporter, partial [Clostridia bacterium]|nr:MATE family efflux transporter [Clostridia bacterium]